MIKLTSTLFAMKMERGITLSDRQKHIPGYHFIGCIFHEKNGINTGKYNTNYLLDLLEKADCKLNDKNFFVIWNNLNL